MAHLQPVKTESATWILSHWEAGVEAHAFPQKRWPLTAEIRHLPRPGEHQASHFRVSAMCAYYSVVATVTGSEIRPCKLHGTSLVD